MLKYKPIIIKKEWLLNWEEIPASTWEMGSIQATKLLNDSIWPILLTTKAFQKGLLTNTFSFILTRKVKLGVGSQVQLAIEMISCLKMEAEIKVRMCHLPLEHSD